MDLGVFLACGKGRLREILDRLPPRQGAGEQ